MFLGTKKPISTQTLGEDEKRSAGTEEPASPPNLGEDQIKKTKR